MKLHQTLLALGLATVAQAHMEMSWPPPFRSKYNPNSGQDIDYSMTSPLKADGSDFPCKGYQSLLGTKEGASVVNWQAGQAYNMTITGETNHNGGSCQASLSYDKAKTFTVIESYVGGCPPMGDSDWKFSLPDDAPAGDALFAWSWFNNIGDREMYMNCAHVTIAAGAKAKARRDASDPLTKRPAMFVANVGNGCSTVEGKDLLFPQPGPDVEMKSTNTKGPVGKCAGSGSGSGSSAAPAESSTPAAAPPSSSAASEAPTSVASEASTPAASVAPTSEASVAPTSAASEAPTSAASVAPTSAGSGRPDVSSLPGGVFITAPSSQGQATATSVSGPASTGAAGNASASTLVTVTTKASGTGNLPPATPSSVSPPPAASSGSSSGTSGSLTPGVACSDEGQWNCVGGTKFQRCASGTWSVLIPMAAGTSCTPGQSATLQMLGKRSGARRYADPWRV